VSMAAKTALSTAKATSAGAAIPIPLVENRRDGWRPAPSDISATPGGTMFAVTPGGTKLAWTRSQMMHYANSPLSKSPLHLPRIPGVTVEEGEPDDGEHESSPSKLNEPLTPTRKFGSRDDDHLFHMDD